MKLYIVYAIYSMGGQFWIQDPTVLLRKDQIAQLWPTESMTSSQKLNAVTRLVVVLTIVGYSATKNTNVLVTAFVTIGLVVLLYFINRSDKKVSFSSEGFANKGDGNGDTKRKVSFQEPKQSNPMMNVMPMQINDHPAREPAAPAFVPKVEEEINRAVQKNVVDSLTEGTPDMVEAVDRRLFQDLGDQLQFDQSMRNFYTTPNTQVPNDQKAFAEFCYGDMPSCKDNQKWTCIGAGGTRMPLDLV